MTWACAKARRSCTASRKCRRRGCCANSASAGRTARSRRSTCGAWSMPRTCPSPARSRSSDRRIEASDGWDMADVDLLQPVASDRFREGRSTVRFKLDAATRHRSRGFGKAIELFRVVTELGLIIRCSGGNPSWTETVVLFFGQALIPLPWIAQAGEVSAQFLQHLDGLG